MLRFSRSSYPYYWVVEVGESLFLAVKVGGGPDPPQLPQPQIHSLVLLGALYQEDTLSKHLGQGLHIAEPYPPPPQDTLLLPRR